MRSMVEGSLATSTNDSHHDTLQIHKHITRGESNRSETTLPHFPVASLIMRNLIWRVMGRSVDLDRKPLAQAGEIKTVRPDRMLSAKLETTGAQTECTPQPDLGGVSGPSILARRFNGFSRGVEDPTTMFHMVPLPVPGRF